MKKSTLFALALGAALAFAPAGQAQEKKDGEKGKGRPSPEERLKQLGEHLKLTDEQKAKLGPILKEEGEKLRAIFQDQNAAQEREIAALREVLREWPVADLVDDVVALRRAGEEREVDGLALDHFRTRGLQLNDDAIPFRLGKSKRVAREVQVDGAVEIAVRERMILVGAEVAGAADRREDALAVGPADELAEDGRGLVSPRGLGVPPALLHDHRHRALRRARGRLVLIKAFLQPALDHAIVGEERLVAALDDRLFVQRGDLAVALPAQRLGVQREALAVNRAPLVDPPDFLLEGPGHEIAGSGAQRGGGVGKGGTGHQQGRSAAKCGIP